MADLWHYTIDGQAREPRSVLDLKELAARGVLKPTDLVWHEGLPQWIRAGSAAELFDADEDYLPAAAIAHDDDTADEPEADRPADRKPADAKPRRKRRHDPDADERRPRRRRVAADDGSGDDFPRRIRRAGMSTGAKIAWIGGGLGTVIILALFVVLIIVLNDRGEVHTVPFRVQDRLTFTDGMDRVLRASRCKVYSVHLDAGTTYSIQMMSMEPAMFNNPLAFDPLLRLEDSSGRQLAQDDDGGGWPNAHISFRAPHTGTYQVIATSFGPTVGRFSLSVNSRF